MKMKINYKIGGYLFVLLGVYHCIAITVDFWVLIKPLFIQYGAMGILALLSNPDPHYVNFMGRIMLLFAYSFGFMMIMFGILCAWIERKLNRAVPFYISIPMLIYFLIGAFIQFPYTHFPCW